MEVHYSISIQIQDFQLTNKMGVTEDYIHFGCDAVQLAVVLDTLPPSSRRQRARLLEGGGVISPATVGKFPSPGTTFSPYIKWPPANKVHQLQADF